MSYSTELNRRLESLNSGSPEARDQLIEHSCERLRKLTRKMLKKFPKVRRWSDTDDVLQVAMMRLHRALMVVKPARLRTTMVWQRFRFGEN
jgi:RNA polymerase sigma-70 factor (ECF subfamily)